MIGVAARWQGDPFSALLELLDPEQAQQLLPAGTS
jgi:ATP-dependent Lon protease